MADALSDEEKSEILTDFREAVNMTASALEKWLQTDESREVGYKEDGAGESVGHRSGEHIVEILHKKKADYTDEDYRHMRKVVGYVRRHSAQRPKGEDVEHTRWTYSLKNWGHDPAKQ